MNQAGAGRETKTLKKGSEVTRKVAKETELGKTHTHTNTQGGVEEEDEAEEAEEAWH